MNRGFRCVLFWAWPFWSFAPQLAAQSYPREEIEFHLGSELLSWCRSEAEAHFAGKGVATWQWSGRHYEKGNVLVVEGSIRAGDKDVAVNCRVAKGARSAMRLSRFYDER